MRKCCNITKNICLIRGDTFPFPVGLSADFAEVMADPESYEGRMVFRDYQDDSLTPSLELIVPMTVGTDLLVNEPPIYMLFEATQAQTQAFKPWDIVYYVEYRYTGPVVSGSGLVKRLFQGKVKVSD